MGGLGVVRILEIGIFVLFWWTFDFNYGLWGSTEGPHRVDRFKMLFKQRTDD